MDIAAFTGAYQGLKAVKEVLNAAFDAKVDSEAKAKVQEALDRPKTPCTRCGTSCL